MAITIAASFQKFKENIEITNPQKETVSTRQQNVRKALEDDFNILDSFLTGSYARSTLVSPLNEVDIDIFIVLHPSYYDGTQPGVLLDRVRTALLKTYPTSPKISRNGQAVTITFTDFKVDVVPAFHRNGGGYLIPDSTNGTYISTNPKEHVEIMSSQNQLHNGDLVPLVKMIKAWNKNSDQAFVSFYLELMAINIFSGVCINDYSSGMRLFFDKGREVIKYKIKDPVTYGGYINPLLNVTTVIAAVNAFETAHVRAKNAENYAINYYVATAVGEWKKIFGDYFPAYG